jgi:hypothetical protein
MSEALLSSLIRQTLCNALLFIGALGKSERPIAAPPDDFGT